MPRPVVMKGSNKTIAASTRPCILRATYNMLNDYLVEQNPKIIDYCTTHGIFDLLQRPSQRASWFPPYQSGMMFNYVICNAVCTSCLMSSTTGICQFNCEQARYTYMPLDVIAQFLHTADRYHLIFEDEYLDKAYNLIFEVENLNIEKETKEMGQIVRMKFFQKYIEDFVKAPTQKSYSRCLALLNNIIGSLLHRIKFESRLNAPGLYFKQFSVPIDFDLFSHYCKLLKHFYQERTYSQKLLCAVQWLNLVDRWDIPVYSNTQLENTIEALMIIHDNRSQIYSQLEKFCKV